MEIMDRKTAQAVGANKYFTGKECSKGHLSPRYTQSGTCVECVLQASRGGLPRESTFAALTAGQQTKEARLSEEQARLQVLKTQRDACIAARAALLEIRLRAYDSDLPTLRELVAAMGQARYPMLAPVEFTPVFRPIDHAGGTALHRFRCAVEDVTFLRDTANVLLNQHKVDVSHVYHDVARQAERMAEEAAAPPPEGFK